MLLLDAQCLTVLIILVLSCVRVFLASSDGSPSTPDSTAQNSVAPKISLSGPATFLVNGTGTLTLRCHHAPSSPHHPAPNIGWGSQCLSFGLGGPCTETCAFAPRVEDDGCWVICFVMDSSGSLNISGGGDDTELQLAVAKYQLNLIYPPPSRPVIEVARTDTNSSGGQLQAGDVLTCTVAGGKPPVRSVHFSCANPALPDQDDVVADVTQQSDAGSDGARVQVSSSIVMNASQATRAEVECLCRAVWEPEPGLYLTTARTTGYVVPYKAKVIAFTVNNQDKLIVLEDDRTEVTFDCEVSGRPSTRPKLYKRGNGTIIAWDYEAEGNGNGNTMSYTASIDRVKCEHMGVYVCEADNGFPQPANASVKLVVECGPRLYREKGSDNVMEDIHELTAHGLSFQLVVYPTPERFAYVFVGSRDSAYPAEQRVVPDHWFQTICRRETEREDLVTCTLRAQEVTSQWSGSYELRVVNPRGQFVYPYHLLQPVFAELQVAESSQLSCTAIAGIAAGGVALLLLVCVVFAVVIVRRKQGRKASTETSTVDTEAAASVTSHPEIPSHSEIPSHRRMTKVHTSSYNGSPKGTTPKRQDSDQAPPPDSSPSSSSAFTPPASPQLSSSPPKLIGPNWILRANSADRSNGIMSQQISLRL